jgi:hypothetical protein
MTRLVVADEVVQAFGGLRIKAIVAAGFDGRGPWPELDERFAALEAAGTPASPATPDLDAAVPG